MSSHVFRTHPALGTVVEVRISGTSEEEASAINDVAMAEITRLESIFTVFDADSEFSRWRIGAVEEPSPELSEVLALALEWKVRSGGAFNPMAGLLADEWANAAAAGRRPTEARLAEIVGEIAEPRIMFERGIPQPQGDASAMNLHAIAKGWIVDRALAAAGGPFPSVSVAVNAGGDLASRGPEALVVGVENPLRPYDDEAPLTFVTLADAAIATSGGARRSFRIGTQRHSHVIDPRSGEPVDHIASITIVAPEAVTADVVATVAGMRTAAAAVRYCDSLDGVAGLVIEPDGTHTASERWADVVITTP